MSQKGEKRLLITNLRDKTKYNIWPLVIYKQINYKKTPLNYQENLNMD